MVSSSVSSHEHNCVWLDVLKGIKINTPEDVRHACILWELMPDGPARDVLKRGQPCLIECQRKCRFFPHRLGQCGVWSEPFNRDLVGWRIVLAHKYRCCVNSPHDALHHLGILRCESVSHHEVKRGTIQPRRCECHCLLLQHRL